MGDRREVRYYEDDYDYHRRAQSRPRSEASYYERREERIEEPRGSRADERLDVRVRERSRSRGPDRPDPLARYFRADDVRDSGALVLREREVETVERPRVREVIRREERLSPAPQTRDNVKVNVNVVKRDRAPSPSPSPPPTPRPVIKGPVIEREVITHYRDVDHGVVYARPPPPPPEVIRKRQTEVDIQTSRDRTDIDISHSHSRERRSSRPPPMPGRWDEEVFVDADRNRLRVDIDDRHGRRAHSERPPAHRYPDEVYDEADYIESRIDDRGRIGEAHNGATRDWTIVDVPPGTERVNMKGAGGGAAEVTWQRYNGVRRTKFIPDDNDRGRERSRSRSRVVVRDDRLWDRDDDRDYTRAKSRDRVNVQVIDEKRGRESEVNVQRIVDDDHRQYSHRHELVPAGGDDMWTEITKDLVVREAIEQLQYDYSETEYFFYILEYLSYDDVQELVQLSDRIRRRRRDRDRDNRSEIDIDVRHRRRSTSHQRGHRDWDDRLYDEEVVVDRLHPNRVYIR